MNADRVWQSRKKSVEELEDILAQRWGTSLSTFTAQDWDEDDDEDSDEIDKSSSDKTVGTPAPFFRAKPVQDPWTAPQEREFYDEDDEGYGSSGVDVSKKDPSRSFDHMIAPKPAGGSGHTTSTAPPRKVKSPEIQQSYFLRPPPTVQQQQVDEQSSSSSTSPWQDAVQSRTTPKASDSIASSSSSEGNNNNKNKPDKRKERIIPIPLLDEEGEPIYLCTAQAQRLFEQASGRNENAIDSEAVDEQFEMEEDQEESPLVTVAAQTDKSWSDLGILDEKLLENLDAISCTTPLPVQQKACPDILQGRDVVIGTYTGSGKTLAFLVPALQRLVTSQASADELRILVVAPGRELASQIVSVARQVCEGTPYTAQLAIGGTTFGRNLQNIRQRKPSILVGTPGRLAELILGKPGERTGRLKMKNLQTLVLDEFDALLEYKPHREPTAALVENLQRKSGIQSILCSATATDVLKSPKFQRFVKPDYALALTDQDDVFVTSDKGPTRVSRTVMHGVVHVPHRRFVLETIRRILHTDPLPQQILIFVDSSRKVDLMVEKLESMGILAAPLHGGDNNDKMDRAEVSKALREGYVGIVVATELAARGLDAPLLTHVINVGLPTDASHYAHRAGRCGRGGRPGVVLNLTTEPQERKVPQKFADQLGIDLYTVDVRNGKLNVVNPESVDLEAL